MGPNPELTPNQVNELKKLEDLDQKLDAEDLVVEGMTETEEEWHKRKRDAQLTNTLPGAYFPGQWFRDQVQPDGGCCDGGPRD